VCEATKPLDLASVLKKKIQPAFRRIGITVWAGTRFGIRLEADSAYWIRFVFGKRPVGKIASTSYGGQTSTAPPAFHRPWQKTPSNPATVLI